MAPTPNVPNEEGADVAPEAVAPDNSSPESRLKKKASSTSLELTKDEVSALLASLTKPPPAPQSTAGVVSCISRGMNGLKSKHLDKNSEEPKLKRDRLTVFGTRYCPWTHRVLLVAAKKNIDVDVININTSDVPSWYLQKHPLGQVPCIQQEDFIAIDSANIVDYLEEKFQHTKLKPETPEDKANDNSFLRLFEQRIPANFKLMLKTRNRDTLAQIWSDLIDDLVWMESALIERGSFLFGGRYVLYVDYCVYPWFERFLALEQLGLINMPWDRIPTLSTWMARMANDKAVSSLRVPIKTMAKVLESFREGNPEYDLENNVADDSAATSAATDNEVPIPGASSGNLRRPQRRQIFPTTKKVIYPTRKARSDPVINKTTTVDEANAALRAGEVSIVEEKANDSVGAVMENKDTLPLQGKAAESVDVNMVQVSSDATLDVVTKETDGIWMGVVDTSSKTCTTSKCA